MARNLIYFCIFIYLNKLNKSDSSVSYVHGLLCREEIPMKIFKAFSVSVVLLFSVMVVHGWTSDCDNTAGIYISCDK